MLFNLEVPSKALTHRDRSRFMTLVSILTDTGPSTLFDSVDTVTSLAYVMSQRGEPGGKKKSRA